MNAMYDISKFVFIISVPDEAFTIFANYIFQHVLIIFSFDFNYNILSKQEHNGVTIWTINKYFNKVVTVKVENR